MFFKGNITPGIDVAVDCVSKHTNQGPSLVTVAEFPSPGQPVRTPVHLVLGPAGSGTIPFTNPAGFALRIDIEVVEPDEVSLRVVQGGQLRAQGTVNQDQSWIFSEAQ